MSETILSQAYTHLHWCSVTGLKYYILQDVTNRKWLFNLRKRFSVNLKKKDISFDFHKSLNKEFQYMASIVIKDFYFTA